MAERGVGRRDVLKAGAGTALAAAAGTARVEAQTAPAAGTRAAAAPLRPADLIFKNGKIFTVDASFTIAQAIAIAGERIVAVGRCGDGRALRRPGRASSISGGRPVIPGLIDGHAHMDREGLNTVYPPLGPVRSIRDIQDRIAELARGRNPASGSSPCRSAIRRIYFDVPDILAEKRWPTRQDSMPRRPTIRSSSARSGASGAIRLRWCMRQHRGLAGAPAFRAIPFRRSELTIEKAADGDPTGVFIENENAAVAELIWFRTLRVLAVPIALHAAASARAYHAFGTTSVFEEHGVATECSAPTRTPIATAR